MINGITQEEGQLSMVTIEGKLGASGNFPISPKIDPYFPKIGSYFPQIGPYLHKIDSYFFQIRKKS